MITDFLHDDKEALRNCSLSCRAMLPSCRVHLFQKIMASSVPHQMHKQSTLACLHQLLQDSPHIGQYIRFLRIFVETESAFEVFVSISDISEWLHPFPRSGLGRRGRSSADLSVLHRSG
ncbi:hypothetical protein OBBRIDRAFT_777042 [Obba rivulosa]|uniref:Uncharacterized protein n=1 Tax=Obba rivulosa TaxID=1052685 RepID=A0A8E2B327_9APHY|nr:hypothetical protein OBBRIDRAFT_777042 [Obba rivulosa]